MTREGLIRVLLRVSIVFVALQIMVLIALLAVVAYFALSEGTPDDFNYAPRPLAEPAR